MAAFGCFPFGPIICVNPGAKDFCFKFNSAYLAILTNYNSILTICAGGGVIWAAKTVLISGNLNGHIGNRVVIAATTGSDCAKNPYVGTVRLGVYFNRLVFA